MEAGCCRSCGTRGAGRRFLRELECFEVLTSTYNAPDGSAALLAPSSSPEELLMSIGWPPSMPLQEVEAATGEAATGLLALSG
eukprot:767956-Hanusia_phi.AAC.4